MTWINALIIFIAVLAAVVLIALLTSLICFLKVFYSPRRKVYGPGEYDLPPGREYEPYYPQIRGWIDEIRARDDRVDLSIKSFDGLVLRGYYYEYSENSPIELLFHGYGGNSERDLSAGVRRCAALGRSCVLIDQRAAGRSDGNVISFGINERRDCLAWINYVKERYPNRPIIIGGISMGAATVMLASGLELPDEVVCVMADCGFSSAKMIIKKVVTEMHLPADLLYPFIKLGARIYGGFDLEADSPIEAVSRSGTPTVFIHGDADGFVPHAMSEELFGACKAQKDLVTIEGAEHGLAYPKNPEKYVESLREFEKRCGFLKK